MISSLDVPPAMKNHKFWTVKLPKYCFRAMKVPPAAINHQRLDFDFSKLRFRAMKKPPAAKIASLSNYWSHTTAETIWTGRKKNKVGCTHLVRSEGFTRSLRHADQIQKTPCSVSSGT